MLDIFSFFTDHLATSQLATIKSQLTDVFMIQKNTKKEPDLRGNWLKVCYLLHIIHPKSILLIFLIIFLNLDNHLPSLTKLDNLFQIKVP